LHAVWHKLSLGSDCSLLKILNLSIGGAFSGKYFYSMVIVTWALIGVFAASICILLVYHPLMWVFILGWWILMYILLIATYKKNIPEETENH
jgi:hypothetical protein